MREEATLKTDETPRETPWIPRRRADTRGEGRAPTSATPPPHPPASRRLPVYLQPGTSDPVRLPESPRRLTPSSGFPRALCTLKPNITYPPPPGAGRTA